MKRLLTVTLLGLTCILGSVLPATAGSGAGAQAMPTASNVAANVVAGERKKVIAKPPVVSMKGRGLPGAH